MTTEQVNRNIGKWVKRAREEVGMTQVQFAKKIGKGRRTLIDYETGKSDLSVSLLLKIAEITGKNIMYFFQE